MCTKINIENLEEYRVSTFDILIETIYRSPGQIYTEDSRYCPMSFSLFGGIECYHGKLPYELFKYTVENVNDEIYLFWRYAQHKLQGKTDWHPYLPDILGAYFHRDFDEAYDAFDKWDADTENWKLDGKCMPASRNAVEYLISLVLGCSLIDEHAGATRAFAYISYMHSSHEYIDAKAIQLLSDYFIPSLLRSSNETNLRQAGIFSAALANICMLKATSSDLNSTYRRLIELSSTPGPWDLLRHAQSSLTAQGAQLTVAQDLLDKTLSVTSELLTLTSNNLDGEIITRLESECKDSGCPYSDLSENIKGVLISAFAVKDAKAQKIFPEGMDVSFALTQLGKAMELTLRELWSATFSDMADTDLGQFGGATEFGRAVFLDQWNILARQANGVTRLGDLVNITTSSKLGFNALWSAYRRVSGKINFTRNTRNNWPGRDLKSFGDFPNADETYSKIRNGYAHDHLITTAADLNENWDRYIKSASKFIAWAYKIINANRTDP